MWKFNILESTDQRQVFRLKAGEPVSHRQFLSLLSENDEFINWYNQLLADCPFDAFFWENKPITNENLEDIYECTLVKSSTLSKVSTESKTFDSYFDDAKNAVSFSNLGGDAKLVAPCPVSNRKIYTQIGSFVREAPDDQILDFWQLVGNEMINHIKQEPRWLSTSGLGVYWLHVRIDLVPKYYQTEAYRTV